MHNESLHKVCGAPKLNLITFMEHDSRVINLRVGGCDTIDKLPGCDELLVDRLNKPVLYALKTGYLLRVTLLTYTRNTKTREET